MMECGMTQAVCIHCGWIIMVQGRSIRKVNRVCTVLKWEGVDWTRWSLDKRGKIGEIPVQCIAIDYDFPRLTLLITEEKEG